jgi:hypothetical protein
MKTKFYQFGIGALLCATMLFVANCVVSGTIVEGSASGGGSVSRPDGTRATLTFNGSSCGGTASGRFNFVDKNPEGTLFDATGIMADGEITSFGQCTSVGGCPVATGQPNCPEGGYLLGFNYRNKNPKVPGDGGTGGACVVDNGEGKKASGPDVAAIGFETGPYATYGTSGNVSGNVQAHLCE